MITLKAYAKLNLSLAVTGIRDDGYHTLDTIMQSISLCDIVTIEKAPDLRVRMDQNVTDEIDNTAYRAAQAFQAQTGCGGADIFIQKNIPYQAGLGGSSADAAAVLIGLDRLYETHLDPQTMAALAMPIGADVPFSLTGGIARATGIGETLTPLTLKNPLCYVVVKPHQGVSTAEAFRQYRRSTPIHMDAVQYALQKGDLSLYYQFAGNALGMAALSIAPDLLKAADALMAAGAKKALMSGSGSSMFSVFQTADEARQTAQRIKGDFALCDAFDSKNTGTEITEESHE